MSDDVRWLIVCDCAGHPEELVGEVEVINGKARVWNTGRSHGAPSLQGGNRMMFDSPQGEQGELMRKLRAREMQLRATVTFSHRPCGKVLRVNETGLTELLAAVSKAVPDQRVSLSVLCALNGRLQRGMTR